MATVTPIRTRARKKPFLTAYVPRTENPFGQHPRGNRATPRWHRWRIGTAATRRHPSACLALFTADCVGSGSGEKSLRARAVELLVTAEWPGNIRQLYNIVRQNVALSRSPVISGALVQSSLGEHAGKLASFSDARDEFTRNYLSQILQITVGNVSQAARLAKRNRTDFYKLLARHDLNPDSFKTL